MHLESARDLYRFYSLADKTDAYLADLCLAWAVRLASGPARPAPCS